MPDLQSTGAVPPLNSAARTRSRRSWNARRIFFIGVLPLGVLMICAGFLAATTRGQEWTIHALSRTPIPYAWLAWKTENPVCTWWQATTGLEESYRTDVAVKGSGKTHRLIRTGGDGHQLWETPLGPWWYPNGSSEESIRFSLAQSELAAYPGLEIRRGDIVLDCGGFVGDWANWVLRAGAARVIIFEPAAGQIECIRRNLAESLRDGRAVLVPKGVWDREELLTLSHWDDNPSGDSVAVNRGPSGETVPLTTIDAAVRELGLQRLDVIKMDIEGAEVRALQGARETLNRFRPRLAVATEHTSDFLQNNRDVLAVMKQIAPFYRPRCGYCRLDRTRKIIPETLYFDPQ